MRKEVVKAFEELIKNANFKYIILSYNDEGIISIEEIKKLCLNMVNINAIVQNIEDLKLIKTKIILKILKLNIQLIILFGLKYNS